MSTKNPAAVALGRLRAAKGDMAESANIMQLKNHLDRVVLAHQINAHYQPGCRERAWRRSRKVRIRPCTSEANYASALHEIGHVVGPQPRRRLDREVAAWNWAKTNAIAWTSTMKVEAMDALHSYLKWSERHKTMARADAKHPIWNWLGGLKP